MSRWLVDYDSTLAETFLEQLRITNQEFDTEYEDSMFVTWRSEDYMPEAHASFMWGPDVFLSECWQLSVPPVPGAIEGCQRLLDQGEHLMIVSDRPPALFDVTRQWLDDHGLDMVRLLFTSHKASSMIPTKDSISKYQAAARYKLDHVVEDAPHHAETFANKPWIERVYLLDRPCNRKVDHPKIRRVHSWNDIHMGAFVFA
jgi:5' nucleotidase, deoxy (Pyrimidine), cytosolic type C protein (NT5C)